jgi:hypothetical protein
LRMLALNVLAVLRRVFRWLDQLFGAIALTGNDGRRYIWLSLRNFDDCLRAGGKWAILCPCS